MKLIVTHTQLKYENNNVNIIRIQELNKKDNTLNIKKYK